LEPDSLSKTIFHQNTFSYYLSGTLISPPTKKRDFMRRYFNFDCRNIFSTLHAQSRGQKKRKAYVQLGISALYYNRAQIDEF
jgi:hypothetical protein